MLSLSALILYACFLFCVGSMILLTCAANKLPCGQPGEGLWDFVCRMPGCDQTVMSEAPLHVPSAAQALSCLPRTWWKEAVCLWPMTKAPCPCLLCLGPGVFWLRLSVALKGTGVGESRESDGQQPWLRQPAFKKGEICPKALSRTAYNSV